MVGLELLKEMEEKMLKIKQNLKASQDMQKSYADKNKNHREFKVGDHVFLRVKANKISLKLEIVQSWKLDIVSCLKS
jgi:exosome complex RNA-binding protein Rrp4